LLHKGKDSGLIKKPGSSELTWLNIFSKTLIKSELKN